MSQLSDDVMGFNAEVEAGLAIDWQSSPNGGAQVELESAITLQLAPMFALAASRGFPEFAHRVCHQRKSIGDPGEFSKRKSVHRTSSTPHFDCQFVDRPVDVFWMIMDGPATDRATVKTTHGSVSILS